MVVGPIQWWYSWTGKLTISLATSSLPFLLSYNPIR